MTTQRSQGAPRHYVSPPDEQRFVRADAPAPLVARDDRGRVVSSAAARALAKMPRAGSFLPRSVKCDARFGVHNRRRLTWLRRRRAELAQLTGEVSHGVGAMLAAAAWLYAGGEYCCERAAETGDTDLFRVAASLTATARTHDFGAWELAVREADARAKRPLPAATVAQMMAEASRPRGGEKP